ncbi:MAG: hypothetical protein KF678_13430 [Phycisphaeraceae bacterium]|nr:hypothetical protein [Phycisphaeraceae bacterium]
MAVRQQIVMETMATRERAEALLRSLLDYKQRSEKSLLRRGRGEPPSRSDGSTQNGSTQRGSSERGSTQDAPMPRTALDSAISSTQRMIEALNRVIAQTNRDMTDEDLEMLEEIGS